MNYPNYPPSQGYPPQDPYRQGYPPSQGYPSSQPPSGPPLPRPTLADFASQPAGGLKPLQWLNPGTRYTAIVSRPIDDGDLEIQRDKASGQPRRFRDGTFMQVLKIPLVMSPTAEYPDGTAHFYCKGGDQAELKRAMQEAGCPDDLHGIPEAGAILTIEYTHDRQVPGGLNPAKVKRITYDRSRIRQAFPDPAQQAPVQHPAVQVPQDTPPWTPQMAEQQGQAAVAQAMASQQPATIQQPQWPAPGAPLSVPPQPAPPGENPYGQQGPAAQVAAATQAGVAAAQAAPGGLPLAPPPGMNEDNARLIAQLTGLQVPPR